MNKPSLSVLAGALSLALFAVACGGGSNTGGPTGPKTGGSIVIAAEQWPDCLNAITSCSNASWAHWAVIEHVLPKAMTLDQNSNFIASPLLTEAPTLANGDLVANPFTVKFKINPSAVWDDGTPITSKDFDFTYKAYLNTTGSLRTNGYDKITSVDTTDPHTAVVHFSEPFADWWDLFGGSAEYVFKASAFPTAGPKADLKDEMSQMISYSGGPWKLESFTKQRAVLVRNAKYWGPAAKFDQVTLIPREDQPAELSTFLSGEAVAINPQPKQGTIDQLKGGTGVKYVVGSGTTYEGLWFNTSKFPLNDKAVREAVGWAADRQAVVDTIIKPTNPDAAVLNCAGWVPTVGQWCDNTQYADLHYDPDKAKKVLQDDGWTLGSDGIFKKNGQRLTIDWSTVAGNTRRENTQALLKEKFKAAGIEITINNFKAGVLFEDKLPKLDFTMGEYAQVASPDPRVTQIYACDKIPSKANNYAGQNFDAWCNQQATQISLQADKTLDVSERVKLVHQLGSFVRQDMVWLPLYQLPLLTAWHADKIGGPIGDFNNTSLGGFYNMNAWGKI